MKVSVGEVWIHSKTRGEYEIIALAKMQTKNELDMLECVVYKSLETGLVWVRPLVDFLEIIDEENNTQRFVRVK